ncbi:MAG: FkbM family methyltransferase [Erythrobacter sp.]|uniref:FkbM family methyltransferase n=1 Tax=Erythrobacter sp. TaxID=1042 RepID=UPI0025E11785|nr:FkbM family methyltransferase [Erythrobacter sp.]MCL9998120.1 FkbM family methyltransferase [Erythrobacter sp.]
MLPARWQVPAKHLFLKMAGGLEAELSLLPQLIRPGERALDIGANYGTYALTLARLGARVDLFEPNPAIAAVLAAWAKGRSGVTVHALALSDREGTAELVIPGEGGVEHDSSAALAGGAVAQGRRVSVPLAPLDSMGITDAALIKIDVEGHEAAVLRGAAATIAASSPALIVEIEQRHIARPISEAFAEVQAMGYRGWFLCSGALLPLEAFDASQHQDFAARGRPYCNNFIFLAESRIARGEYAGVLARGAA